MNSQDDLPQSGYQLLRIYATEQHYALEEKDSAELPEGAGLLNIAWDWNVAGERLFDVVLSLELFPSRDRPERLAVSLVGAFRATGEQPTVPFADFVQFHAPAILFPYAREYLSALQGRGFFGPAYLPATNVAALMRNMNPAITTGAEQLATNRELAASFGLAYPAAAHKAPAEVRS